MRLLLLCCCWLCWRWSVLWPAARAADEEPGQAPASAPTMLVILAIGLDVFEALPGGVRVAQGKSLD